MDLLFVYSGDFGEKVLGNLINYDGFCSACDVACNSCRFRRFDWSSDIKCAVVAPGPTDAQIIDESDLPLNQADAEVALLIDVHPDVIMDFVQSLGETRIKAVIVPVDRPGIGPGLIGQLESVLDRMGIEFAHPKPFCSLSPTDGGHVIERFVERYAIGRPLIDIQSKRKADGEVIISGAKALRSSPCGATWYICKRLVRTRVDFDAISESVSRSHHSYPCTASMDMDREIGDTFLHRGGYIARESVLESVKRHLLEEGMGEKAEAINQKIESQCL